MEIINYVKPELLIVSLALYFVGKGIKSIPTIKDKYIPLILGILGIMLCALWVFANKYDSVAMALFVSVVQGILVAGLSTYVNQIFKQLDKEK